MIARRCPYLDKFSLLLIIFFIINLSIFIYANTRPIYWIQHEIPSHGFFWSMNGLDDFGLHTGFRKVDFLKPFHSFYIDGVPRLRQVSYFLEMISFKFWQYFGKVFDRDYTLIFLHILNTILAGLLIFSLTKNKRAACYFYR